MRIRLSMYVIVGLLLSTSSVPLHAQTVSVDASKLVSRVEVQLSPRTGSFVEGSTFQVPILVNTRGASINGIEIRLNYDKNKLSIMSPSSGTSIVGVWAEPPKYDNTKGTASYVGVVPSGIVTGSGLIGMVTFKAIGTGHAVISINSNSRVLLNDGLGTEAGLEVGRAEYTILPKSPEGVKIFSETHPVQSDWSNNNNPSFSWERDPGVDGFSYELDNKPSTIPDNTVESNDTSKSFDNLTDGLWYFHIKAKKGVAWGTTGHYLIRIDTAPPAEFTPEASYLLAAAMLVERTLVSFFTTDNLSGIDHYEVGVIDKNQPVTVSPVFVESDSPFQVPIVAGSDLQVIVRAIDKAGNVRDASVDIQPPFVITKFIKDYIVYILSGIILAGLVSLIIHYLVGHHVIRYMRRIRAMDKADTAQGEVSPPVVPPTQPHSDVMVIPPKNP